MRSAAAAAAAASLAACCLFLGALVGLLLFARGLAAVF